jgi:hypothetical protein
MSYRQTILATPDLVACWPLADYAEPLADISGNHRSAVLSGAGVTLGYLSTLEGRRAIEIGSDYGEVPLDAALNGEPFSVECWANVAAFNATEERILHCLSGLNGPNGWAIGRADTGVDEIFFVRIGSARLKASTKPTAIDTWYHIVATFDGTDVVLYIDGAADTTSAPAFTANATQPFRIGANNSGAPFDGRIAWVSYYARDLSADEVAEHYLAGLAGFARHTFGATIKGIAAANHTFGATLVHRATHSFGAYLTTGPSDRGFLNTTSRDALVARVPEDWIYNSDTAGLQVYNGATWDDVSVVERMDALIAQQRYVSGPGVTSVADSDFSFVPPDGWTAVAHDTTSGKHYLCIRSNGAWSSVEAS